jgi:hypothetical protein
LGCSGDVGWGRTGDHVHTIRLREDLSWTGIATHGVEAGCVWDMRDGGAAHERAVGEGVHCLGRGQILDFL